MQNINTPQPLVSVVIASYNMAQYIGQAINSILAQTWQPLEIIVVDDGSTDNTAEVMASYASNKHITYIATPNQGQPKAKNTGILAATGEYIAFCDADDFWEKDKLTQQMPSFKNSKVGIVYSEVSYIDEHDRRYLKPHHYQRYSGKVTEQLLIRNFIPFGTAVIRRACIEKNGIFDENFRMGIDWDLWLRYSLDWEFAFVSERTYIYREWSGQMSSNYRGRYQHAYLILAKFIKQHGDNVSPKIINRANADMYINEANAIATNECKFFEPLKGYLKGIKTDPSYLHGWKSLIKLFIGMHKNNHG